MVYPDGGRTSTVERGSSWDTVCSILYGVPAVLSEEDGIVNLDSKFLSRHILKLLLQFVLPSASFLGG
jgi:hypothetical protein